MSPKTVSIVHALPAAAVLLLTGVDGRLSAHGLMEDPPSRSWICGEETKPDDIINNRAKTPACSTAFAVNPLAAYNFMSVVTHSWGRSQVTPLPKNVCGFDGEFWKGAKTPWDAAMDWPATAVSAGPRTITWNISWGPHFDDTKEFRYWITKPGFTFSPSKELTWEDFEAEPFCVLDYNDKTPTANPDVTPDMAGARFKTRCTLPERSGRHVIYGEWGRTEPTIERFHGCIDVAYGGTTSLRSSATPARAFSPRPSRFPGFSASDRDALGRRLEAAPAPSLPTPDLRSPAAGK